MSYIRFGNKIGNKKSRFYLWDCGYLAMAVIPQKGEKDNLFYLKNWEVKLLIEKFNKYLEEQHKFKNVKYSSGIKKIKTNKEGGIDI